ncbi:hypothetical protein BJX61DRAFT_550733 [Aspergillus egyptiacus]|nr:hypothetical protein BJX61DRAFT_550733 [Aspergillus egyptiacus]
MAAKYAAVLPFIAGALAADASFESIQPGFSSIVTPNSSIQLVLENNSYPFAHEAPVYLPSTGDLFVVANYQTPTGGQPIQISRISHDASSDRYTREIVPADIPNANGAINYNGQILFAAQGSTSARSALILMNPAEPYNTTVLLDNYKGRRFNSLNDLDVHSDGSIWFTDPTYGFVNGFSPEPELPNQVYRFDPATGDVRVVADHFGQPNGIAFSPDEEIVYISDTEGDSSLTLPATIYAFDIAYYSDAPYLINKRVFAFADTGIPDGVKTDTEGRVYSGCGDGVHVWSPEGVLLGKIVLGSTSSNLCFAEPGVMFALNEERLYRVTLDSSIEGTIL